MKTGMIFFITVVSSWGFTSFKQDKKSEIILGEWYYKNSLIEDTHIKLSTDKHCPVFKMCFSLCDDRNSIELKKLPVYVKEQRRNNFFENIKCQTFDDLGNKIDIYYPVCSKEGENLGVVNYGMKYKSFYTIEKISKDTLIVFDGKQYTIEGIETFSVRHIYTKR